MISAEDAGWGTILARTISIDRGQGEKDMSYRYFIVSLLYNTDSRQKARISSRIMVKRSLPLKLKTYKI